MGPPRTPALIIGPICICLLICSHILIKVVIIAVNTTKYYVTNKLSIQVIKEWFYLNLKTQLIDSRSRSKMVIGK